MQAIAKEDSMVDKIMRNVYAAFAFGHGVR